MISQLKSSVVLLAVLGLLFSLPIAAKTWSAHGALPAMATACLAFLAAYLGPLTLLIVALIPVGFLASTYEPSALELIVFMGCGAGLIVSWQQRLLRGAMLPYLPVTCWALLGAYAPIMLVFSHLG